MKHDLLRPFTRFNATALLFAATTLAAQTTPPTQAGEILPLDRGRVASVTPGGGVNLVSEFPAATRAGGCASGNSTSSSA